MLNTIDILAVDDDKFVQKMIVRALQSSGLTVRTASDGESGFNEAIKTLPDIVILDVEMPGLNGYELCDKLRNTEVTKDLPIVFLSSHTSLRERLHGYENGADDYIVKPFEAEHLLARIKVLIKYQTERRELRAQYEFAQKTAITALTGSSELGLVMQFMEKSLKYHHLDDLIHGLFESTNQFSLECCIMIINSDQLLWYSSRDAISPLEKELMEMCDRDTRFLDFTCRTIINFPSVSLLVKNMPIEDMETYGRLKDLLPIMLSAVNTKILSLITEEALTQQSYNLLGSFKMIRRNLYDLGSTIVTNRNESREFMNNMVQEINHDLFRMGLDEDQENYLLNRIDSAIEEAMEQMNAGKEIRQVLTFILSNLKNVMNKQEILLNDFTESQARDSTNNDDEANNNIELF